MGRLLNIKEASSFLNVTQDCLRKWHKSGKLVPYTTAGGHRRYDEDMLNKFIGIETKEYNTKEIITATYARVSSNSQKQSGDLDRQSQRLSEYCANNNIYVEYIIKDVGSGLNDNRKGFNKLSDLILKKKINQVIIENKDRLTRFQYNFIKKIFNNYGCEIIVVNDTVMTDNEELTTDMMALLASFSGKYYGKRSIKNRKSNKK